MTTDARYICPHCKKVFTWLRYWCNYTEYGKEWGRASISDDDVDEHEQDDRSYDDGSTDNYEYQCPNCDKEIDAYDLESLRGGGTEKEKEPILETV